ncbi:UNVERIFIED_CONTAM: hypothetical protein FKN15_001195 [Acipenser sinensis]
MQQFPNMQSVTVCAYIQFDPSCLGVSTVFSYSIQSFINEFQLRANIVHGEPIQLALLVHGIHSPYSLAGDNDGLWHFVCVSWTRDDGRWAIYMDGSVVGSGDKLFPSNDIGQNGVFIIGQEQDTFGSSFKKEESFTGNITQLHVWNQVLNSSAIQSMARDCSVISEGLFFTWNFSALQLEPSLKIHWVFSQCQDNRSQTVGQMPFDWIDGGSISYHNFSLNVNYMPITGECVTIDPVTGSCCLEACSKPKRALCQYDKDVYEHLQRFSLIPQTSFFFAVSREPLASTVIDELQINPTGILRNLSRVNSLTGVLLKVLDENPDILTSADLLYLTQFMGTVVELGVVEMENVSEAFVSLATNWFKLASKVIDTGLSAQWLELTEQAVACTAVAALLHLFFMAAFTWMLVEGLLLWSKVVTVNLSEERRMKYYYLIGWGLPVLIVSITLAATSEKYSADGHCWLSVKNGVIWGFAGPVIFIIMVNILVLTRVVLITLSTAKRRAIMLTVNSNPVEQAYDQIRAAVKAVLVLLPILGLTWLCGVLVPFSIVMAYIFVLLNSLQVCGSPLSVFLFTSPPI